MNGFPAKADDVSAEWLERHLEGSPFAEDGPIHALSWEPIGTGQVGDSVRFHLEHADGKRSTLAAKFPAADPKSRATAAMLGLYAKEVRFYTDIAPHLAVRTPQIAHAEMNAEGTEFLLLFEDLGPARVGDQLAGCDIEEARAAIRQAAAIHGPSWENEAIIGADWIHTPEAVTQQVNALYPQAQAVFRERYSGTLEREYMALCEEVAALPELSAVRLSPPQCIVHRDFRLDNMLFDIKDAAEPIAILDWQTIVAGRAMTDIGYLMGTGFGDELRRRHEDDLLALYCSEMAQYGVTLSRDHIWREYRIGALHGLTTAVFSAAFVERTERGDANFLSMARGACALALEHNSLGALKENV